MERDYSMDIDDLFEGIDGYLFKQQRRLIGEIIEKTTNPDEEDLLLGLQNLLDGIADIAHDKYGINCLFLFESDGEIVNKK